MKSVHVRGRARAPGPARCPTGFIHTRGVNSLPPLNPDNIQTPGSPKRKIKASEALMSNLTPILPLLDFCKTQLSEMLIGQRCSFHVGPGTEALLVQLVARGHCGAACCNDNIASDFLIWNQTSNPPPSTPRLQKNITGTEVRVVGGEEGCLSVPPARPRHSLATSGGISVQVGLSLYIPAPRRHAGITGLRRRAGGRGHAS